MAHANYFDQRVDMHGVVCILFCAFNHCSAHGQAPSTGAGALHGQRLWHKKYHERCFFSLHSPRISRPPKLIPAISHSHQPAKCTTALLPKINTSCQPDTTPLFAPAVFRWPYSRYKFDQGITMVTKCDWRRYPNLLEWKCKVYNCSTWDWDGSIIVSNVLG